ncbi:MAG: hypothetical protein MSJ26_10810 [Oscillospiraceae bacterium]|nr:hypothetical protein [Oscillospiraceae bacterium]
MKKTQKGSASHVILVIILILIIAAIIFFCLNGFGLGFGSGNGSGNNDSAVPANVQINETVATESESVTTTIETETIEYWEITISGNNYIFNNHQTELEALIETITSSDVKHTVRLTDENASQKAYSDLTKALKENDIQYIEEE